MPNLPKCKTIRLTQLAKLAGINYFRVWRRKKGITEEELDLDTRTKLVNALLKDINVFVEFLGFELSIKRKA